MGYGLWVMGYGVSLLPITYYQLPAPKVPCPLTLYHILWDLLQRNHYYILSNVIIITVNL